MDMPKRMKFGSFLGPFHRVGENPTLALDRDLESVSYTHLTLPTILLV